MNHASDIPSVSARLHIYFRAIFYRLNLNG